MFLFFYVQTFYVNFKYYIYDVIIGGGNNES